MFPCLPVYAWAVGNLAEVAWLLARQDGRTPKSKSTKPGPRADGPPCIICGCHPTRSCSCGGACSPPLGDSGRTIPSWRTSTSSTESRRRARATCPSWRRRARAPAGRPSPAAGQTSFFYSMPAASSDIHPTRYVVHGEEPLR